MANRPNSDGDPFNAAEQQEAQFRTWLAALRAADPDFAAASVLHPDTHSEWQSAVYMLTGNDSVWHHFGPRVTQEASIDSVLGELENETIKWSSSALLTIEWAGCLWGAKHTGAEGLPSTFERYLFHRWVTACFVRRRIVPSDDLLSLAGIANLK